jgi:hypothetical protein
VNRFLIEQKLTKLQEHRKHVCHEGDKEGVHCQEGTGEAHGAGEENDHARQPFKLEVIVYILPVFNYLLCTLYE